MAKKLILLILSLIIAVIFAFSMFFIVDEAEQAVIFQFGEPVRVVKKSGLNVKIPFLQKTIYFNSNTQEIDIKNKEIVMSDQKIIINAYINYKIIEPVFYHKTVNNENAFKNEFSKILDMSLKEVIDNTPSKIPFSEKINDIEKKVRNIMDEKTKKFGVEVTNVILKMERLNS